MPDLTPYAIAVGGITAMLMVWLGVQRVWGQVFAVGNDDVLQVRAGCEACDKQANCHLPSPQRSTAPRPESGPDTSTDTCAAPGRDY